MSTGDLPPDPKPGSGGRRFLRPWEHVEAPAEIENTLPEEGEVWTALETAKGGRPFDALSDDYLAATTREYQGLAADVAKSQDEVVERQPVAAQLPGVGSGLVGFEDVTGVKLASEEESEHLDQQHASDLTVRIGTGLVLLGLFVGTLMLGGWYFTSFITLVMILAAGELFSTTRTRGYRPVPIATFIGLILMGGGAHVGGASGMTGGLVTTILVVCGVFSFQERRDPLENAAVTVMATVWVGALAFAAVIGRSENSFALILFAVLVTAVFDVGAYGMGRAFGRRKIAPVVSPHKTFEGLIGGVVAAFLMAAALSTLPPFNPPITFAGSLIVAMVVSVFAPLGDAAESVVKRALDVKDMGAILPGHGGMLDRIDALLFVVPAVYVVFSVLGYL